MSICPVHIVRELPGRHVQGNERQLLLPGVSAEHLPANGRRSLCRPVHQLPGWSFHQEVGPDQQSGLRVPRLPVRRRRTVRFRGRDFRVRDVSAWGNMHRRHLHFCQSWAKLFVRRPDAWQLVSVSCRWEIHAAVLSGRIFSREFDGRRFQGHFQPRCSNVQCLRQARRVHREPEHGPLPAMSSWADVRRSCFGCSCCRRFSVGAETGNDRDCVRPQNVPDGLFCG
mmetsp:Transcript_26565/g.62797  ORF Transcript_26565/g.62797 Transcript_26565/m.62797 type:complete len:226 (-) Transcript_26565:9270-9947(-)